MPKTDYISDLDGEQIEAALEAIHSVVTPSNNGKVLCIAGGKIVAKSASEWGGGGYPEPTGTIPITANGTVNVKDYETAEVNVPSGITAADEGKVVKNGALVAQTARATAITANGTYDTAENNSVTVNVSGGGVSRKTQAEWDALSFSEKQALGLTAVGNPTDISGEWFNYSIINYLIDFCSASGDGKVDTKTVYVDNFANYDRLAVFVAVNDNNTGTIEIDGVSQTVTKSGDVYFCATLIAAKASFPVTIGHGDGGSAMYSVAVFGLLGLTSCTNYPAYIGGKSGTVNVANYHSAAIVDILTDRVSGSCFFDGSEMVLAKIGRGYFGDLYHAFLIVNGILAGTKQLSGNNGVKCFQILGLDN